MRLQKRVIVGMGLSVLLVGGGIVLSRMFTTDRDDFPSDSGPPNPLPECPNSPNCVRVTWVFDLAPDALFKRAAAAIRNAGASSMDVDQTERRIDAVFDVFVFKDDVAAEVEAFGDGAAMHLRSASRVGYSDLGVNGRRVRRIEKLLSVGLPGRR